jgi:hypothetical protein
MTAIESRENAIVPAIVGRRRRLCGLREVRLRARFVPAGVMIVPLLFASDASGAAPLPGYIWKSFGGDGASASLLVIDKNNADDPEAHSKFYLGCTVAEPWTMNVSDIDNKALGQAIVDNKQPTIQIVINGKAEGEQGAYTPDIIFNQEDSAWEYTTGWDLSLLDPMIAGTEIAIKGIGVDLTLPTDGMKEAISQFKADCEALQATTDEGEPDDTLLDEPVDTPENTP